MAEVARTEPSMDEILASIKRIIADDAPGMKAGLNGSRISPRADLVPRGAPVPPAPEPVLELTVPVGLPPEDMEEPVAAAPQREAPAPPPAAVRPAPSFARAEEPVAPPLAARPAARAANEAAAPPSPPTDETAMPPSAPAATLVSADAAGASRQSLSALSSLVVRPAAGEVTLDGMVRDMLRPMLKEWLDANLPAIVEKLVAREIARITAQDD